MKETTLWDHLRPELQLRGKFQKISDRFTPGVPDVIGMCNGIGRAWELKEFDGVVRWRLKFRPLQLDWLRDWELAGGQSLVISSHRQTVFAHEWQDGEALEAGMAPEVVRDSALLAWTKTRTNQWRECVNLLLTLTTMARRSAPSVTLSRTPGKLRKRRSGPN